METREHRSAFTLNKDFVKLYQARTNQHIQSEQMSHDQENMNNNNNDDKDKKNEQVADSKISRTSPRSKEAEKKEQFLKDLVIKEGKDEVDFVIEDGQQEKKPCWKNPRN